MQLAHLYTAHVARYHGKEFAPFWDCFYWRLLRRRAQSKAASFTASYTQSHSLLMKTQSSLILTVLCSATSMSDALRNIFYKFVCRNQTFNSAIQAPHNQWRLESHLILFKRNRTIIRGIAIVVLCDVNVRDRALCLYLNLSLYLNLCLSLSICLAWYRVPIGGREYWVLVLVCSQYVPSVTGYWPVPWSTIIPPPLPLPLHTRS